MKTYARRGRASHNGFQACTSTEAGTMQAWVCCGAVAAAGETHPFHLQATNDGAALHHDRPHMSSKGEKSFKALPSSFHGPPPASCCTTASTEETTPSHCRRKRYDTSILFAHHRRFLDHWQLPGGLDCR